MERFQEKSGFIHFSCYIRNWYVTAYFGMMCLIPMIRLAMDYIDQRIYKRMLIGIFAIYIALPTLVSYLLQGSYYPDPFNVNRGYSSLWLCIMYLFGAYIRKYFNYHAVKKRLSLSVFGCMVLLTFLSKIIMEKLAIQRMQMCWLIIHLRQLFLEVLRC